MIPRFSLVRPQSLEAAFDAFDLAGGDAAWYAGGTELLQVMKMGLAQFAVLIDLKGIAELGGIAEDPDGTLRIGATVTHRAIEDNRTVSRALPALVGLEHHLANIRVRNQGTLGGNLVFAEPHSDPATLLLACGASVELAGPGGRRSLLIDEFVLGPLYTAREPDEILTAIRVPAGRAGEGRAYDKVKFFERPAVSVGVRVRVDEGRISECAVTVGSLAEVPMLVAPAAASLIGAPAASAGSTGDELTGAITAAAAAVMTLDAEDDLNGSADYKRHLAGILLGRTVRAALAEATANA